MNRPALLILTLLILSLHVLCQEKLTDKDAPAIQYKCGDLSLAPLKNPASFPFPADSIVVSDLRQETSKFGYYHATGGTFTTTKFCFKNNTAAEIAGFFNGSFNKNLPATKQKLLYCLKKLWIVSADTINTEQFKRLITRSKLYLKAEIYFEKNDCYYPLYRFDSIFIRDKVPAASDTQWVKEALIQSLERLKTLPPERVTARACMRRTEIDSYYADEKRTALSQGAKPKKGVYLTFEQFKNNQPAFTEFNVNFGRIADVMEIKEKDGNTTTKKDWGFCDDEACYIRLGQNYFRLFKIADTYDLYGTTNEAVNSNGIPLATGGRVGNDNIISEIRSASLKTARRNLSKSRPLQLDMETGKVY